MQYPVARLTKTGARLPTASARPRETHLGGERQFAGSGVAALAKLVGAYGGLQRKHIKSIAARRMHLSDQKSAHELMIARAEKRAAALERYLRG